MRRRTRVRSRSTVRVLAVAAVAAATATLSPAAHAGVEPSAATEVNVLVRGQSNALLFCDRGGAAELETGLETRLGTDVHLLYRWGEPDSTIHSGSAFMDWDTDGKQAGLVRYAEGLPADVKDNPTLTLWLHNEYDQGNGELTTADWTREVRADADLVRGALGQSSATTPYLFVPIRYPYGSNWQAIGDGMAELDTDGSFNADISWEAQDLVMDGDGYPDSSHMGDADAVDLGGSLVDAAAGMLAPLTGPDTRPAADWTLAYEDSFDGTELDTGVWDAIQGVSGHSKVQWVKDNVSVGGGVVTLTVETTLNEGGAISTQTSDLVQPYGKYELRARIDEGVGVGMALLLWPQSQQWPRDGEIDFAETPRRDRVHFTNHYEDENGQHQYETGHLWLDATQWHTYGVEWTPDSITYLVDGEVRQVMTEHIPSGPMFMGLQTEYMGDCQNGDWIPCPDDTTPDIVRAQIDDVRIYRLT